MPAKTKSQFRLMKAAENNPAFAKKVGIKPSVAKEFTQGNVGKKAYKELPMKDGGPSLSVGRGEKLPVSQGAGLTAKGREKYNRETGSNLKPPQPEGGPRKKSFCARSAGQMKMWPEAAKDPNSRLRQARKRWKC
jgi:hypothetical protein